MKSIGNPGARQMLAINCICIKRQHVHIVLEHHYLRQFPFFPTCGKLFCKVWKLLAGLMYSSILTLMMLSYVNKYILRYLLK